MILYHESGIDAQLEATLLIDETQFCIYGDSAYILRASIQRGYGAWPDGDAEEQAYDGAMNRLREAVEWGFKEVKQKFTSLDFKINLKTCKTSVGAQYLSTFCCGTCAPVSTATRRLRTLNVQLDRLNATCSAKKTDMGTAPFFSPTNARERHNQQTKLQDPGDESKVVGRTGA